MESDLVKYIRALTAQTAGGVIQWQKQSDAVFSANVKGKANLVLQRVGNQRLIFRAIDTASGTPVINIGNHEKPEMDQPLRDLFIAVDKNIDATGASFLKSLLD